MTNVIDLKTKKPNHNAKANLNTEYEQRDAAKCAKIYTYLQCMQQILLKADEIYDVELFQGGIDCEVDELLDMRRKHQGWSRWKRIWAKERKRKPAHFLFAAPIQILAGFGLTYLFQMFCKCLGF